MNTYDYTVKVQAASRNEADQVMGERLAFDEDYGFFYTVEWANIEPSVADIVREALEGDSNDAEHDALVLAAEALGISYDEGTTP